MAQPVELGGINDPEARRALEELALGLGEMRQFFSFGIGAPTSSPAGRGIYLRLDGAGSTTLYVWEGAAWVGK